MISPEDFTDFLDTKGFRFYTGVPCSYFKHVISLTQNDSRYSYYAAPNEGAALAAAGGAFLAGEGPVVMIQNSGLGNLLNPLTSLSMIYEMPALLLVSGRAYGIPDEPQHEIMGRTMGSLLDSIGIQHWDLPLDETWKQALEAGLQKMKEKKVPVAFFVHKGTFSSAKEKKEAPVPAYPMKRVEALSVLKTALDDDCAVFATTGKISRELFAVGDRPGNFYMQGSMGHIGALAFGYAISNPEKRVVAVDGDGAFLMHMGNASMIGHYAPRNFVHILLDNESYETTGDQDTTASTTDLEAVARACGYRQTAKAEDAETLKASLAKLKSAEGPVFLWVKINRLETSGIPRITSKYSAPEITRHFQDFAKSGGQPVSKKP